jgi:hypothetical protein
MTCFLTSVFALYRCDQFMFSLMLFFSVTLPCTSHQFNQHTYTVLSVTQVSSSASRIVGRPWLFFLFTFHLMKFSLTDSPLYGRTLGFLGATSIKSKTKMVQAASHLILGKRLYLCKVSWVKHIIFPNQATPAFFSSSTHIFFVHGRGVAPRLTS